MDDSKSEKYQKHSDTAEQIFETIVNYNRERLEQEHSHNYLAAGRIKQHLKQLGEEYQRAVLMSIRERQRTERDGLEVQYEKEIGDISIEWEKRLEENEEEIKNSMTEIQERHGEELQKYENRLKENMPIVGRMPAEVLNLEYQIAQLVKDQRYDEAAVLQKKLDRARADSHLKINYKTEEKIRNLLETAIKKQENEIMALEKRLNKERDDILKNREKEFEAVHSKYKVYREKLESNHNSEFIKEEKKLKKFNPSSNYLAYEE